MVTDALQSLSDPKHDAYHESGHAVVAHTLRMALGRVSIVKHNDGVVEGCKYDHVPSTTEVERAIAVMAGAAAIELFFGFEERGATLDVYEFIQIRARAQTNGDWPEGLTMQGVIERAKEILREHPRAVHALATELLRLSVLTGQVAVRIIEENTKPGKPAKG